jgi:hypothetical protein
VPGRCQFIARDVEMQIERALPAGDVQDGAVIRVDLEDSEPTVTYQILSEPPQPDRGTATRQRRRNPTEAPQPDIEARQ